MIEWWNGLELFLKVLYCIAIPAAVVLILQTIMLVVGFGDGADGDTGGVDADADVDAGGDFGTDDGELIPADSSAGDFSILQLFTIQGAVAFFCVFGWSSIIFRTAGLEIWLCIVIGLILGIGAMFGVSKLIRLSGKLASNGAVNYNNAVGMTAVTYIKIPAGGREHGKVNFTMQGRLVEADAVTFESEDIQTGSQVKITKVTDDDTLVCIPVKTPADTQVN